MRWSQTFIPTMKETPAEAEIISHKLLLRAGLVRKLTGGLYTFLPLGLRALRKIEAIVREEMNRAGALEVFMPALQPPDIWARSGRLETAREVLFHVKDRAQKEWVLGPTHEEVITTLVANEFNSYRQLPVNFYQIQTKFRDEIRPRFGLMRAKEFIMKDAYSFDADDESANASYQLMYDAYARIFKRCGLRAIAVQADTGVMGGAHSHEFMVPAETGENEVVYCESGDYAANIEMAASQGPAATTPADVCGEAEKFETPGVKTIGDLAKRFGIAAERQIKTLVYIADDKPVIVLLRGDDQLEEAKLGGALSTGTIRAAGDAEIVKALGAQPGSLGAVGVEGIPVYADEVLRGGSGMVTGANDDGHHLRNVNVERDITVSDWADLRQVQAGELCVETGQPLKIRRAIEVGHVFKLGTKYSEALGATFLDENGDSIPSIMGCYGIGVTRTLQAVIEQCHDDNGVIWPTSVAPYQVCITALDVEPESEVMKLATHLYDELQAKGVDVILDDRPARPGIKFKDSELAGFPLRIGIGERSLAKGNVEIKPRTGEMILCSPDEALGQALEWLEANRVG
ncbi:MAG: proline--tRNA ligase [Verrucomicrobiota bacterium]|jgi:prolyl-tRNA synthetase|nr:proline--tRNA ligase [Verrucomicrobiota bacterium]MDP7293112.1 proline--tRNA ligase [Verrucomicrobiota bacterium]MDP7441413.1 proline--tRNA ligase [Verrucomicrobiota bacterium]